MSYKGEVLTRPLTGRFEYWIELAYEYLLVENDEEGVGYEDSRLRLIREPPLNFRIRSPFSSNADFSAFSIH